MDTSSERMVIEALQALESGQPIAEILKRYPQNEDELRPILETAVALSKVRVAHSLAAQAESRQQMMARATAMSNGADQPPALFVWFRRMTMALSPLLVIFVIVIAGLFFASSEALPGDFLYNTKREVEDLRLSLTTNLFAREDLQKNFEEERILEIEQLLESGQQAEVSFRGVIESVNEDTWIVAGLRVSLTSLTEVEGQPIAGRIAWIEAMTSDGKLIANAITIEFVPEPSPTPEPTPQEAKVITPEVPPTATPTSTSTPTATATETPMPTATATPTKVILIPATSPTETPTASSGDSSNANEGSEVNNDNDNENVSGGNENDGDGNDNDGDDVNENNDNHNDNDDDSSNDNDNDDSGNENDGDDDGDDNDNDDSGNENDGDDDGNDNEKSDGKDSD